MEADPRSFPRVGNGADMVSFAQGLRRDEFGFRISDFGVSARTPEATQRNVGASFRARPRSPPGVKCGRNDSTPVVAGPEGPAYTGNRLSSHP